MLPAQPEGFHKRVLVMLTDEEVSPRAHVEMMMDDDGFFFPFFFFFFSSSAESWSGPQVRGRRQAAESPGEAAAAANDDARGRPAALPPGVGVSPERDGPGVHQPP